MVRFEPDTSRPKGFSVCPTHPRPNRRAAADGALVDPPVIRPLSQQASLFVLTLASYSETISGKGNSHREICHARNIRRRVERFVECETTRCDGFKVVFLSVECELSARHQSYCKTCLLTNSFAKNRVSGLVNWATGFPGKVPPEKVSGLLQSPFGFWL